MNTDRIEKTVFLRASLDRVWRALTDSAEFGAWFGMRADGPFQPGRQVRAVIAPTTVDPEVAAGQKPYEGTPFVITIERMEPQHLFSFRWHPYAVEPGVDYASEPTTLVVFTLEEQNGGVLLTVTESGFDQIPLERRAQAFTSNERGWAVQMRLIEAYLVRRP
jgi:uncharacterized protein YndB with AHSA1/START domain